jgi:REP element-mobilizing transposase RayT
MSRVVDRRFIFGEEEKEFFRQTMRKLEAFTGIRILTYCIMSNHWHILLEVPSPANLDDTELFERIDRFYSKQRAKALMQEFERAAKHAEQTGSDVWLNELREQYLSRMGNLSIFVKELKERFSKWYNRKHARRGTLWEERFKSVLVEDSETAISTMAAYIDLNPVRAELVDDPRDYRFCGYAEAVAGGETARRGIEQVLMQDPEASWRKIAAQYRMHLFSSGEQTAERKGICSEEVEKVLAEGGELSRTELLRCRVRYFSDGVALGSKLFVEEVFENNRSLFSERRKNGARKLHGGDWLGLCSLRDLSQAVAAPG